MTGPLAPARSRGLLAALLVAGALACAACTALGAWQLRRLAWKQDLIVRVESHLRAAPLAAPGPAEWGALGRADEYRRVRLRGRYEHERETAVRAVTALGGGYWILTPMLCEDGFRVLVNRGFVPAELRSGATRSAHDPAGAQELTGLLRLSEPGGSLLQRNDPAADRWVSRDVQALAAARGLERAVPPAPVAPYFVDVAADSAAPAAWPRAGLTVVRFSNNHLVYAATWFALALMTAGAMVYLVVDARRRPPGERPLAHDRD